MSQVVSAFESKLFRTLIALTLILAGVGLQRWLSGEALPLPSPDALPVLDGGRPTLMEFGMDTCASCRAMGRVLAELRDAHGDRLQVVSINILQQEALTREWEVRVLPTQVLLDGEGRVLDRHVGFLSADAIRQRFAERGWPLDGNAR